LGRTYEKGINMNPLLGIGEALLRAGAPLVGGLLTTAATAAGGPIAGAAAGMVIGALAEALGLDPKTATPADVQARIEADPAAARDAAERVEASHGQAAADLAARLADIQDAREMQTAAMQSGSYAAWTPHVLAYILTFAFLGAIAALFFKGLPESNIVMMLIGALISEFRGALSFFFGSSSSSKDKDAAISLLTRVASPVGKAVKK
jgi:hypothetical protein